MSWASRSICVWALSASAALASPAAEKHLIAAQALRESLQYEDALEQLKEAEALKPTDAQRVQIWLEESVILYEMHDPDKSEAAARRALALDPDAQPPGPIAPRVKEFLDRVRAEMKLKISRYESPPGARPEPPPQPPAPASPPPTAPLAPPLQARVEQEVAPTPAATSSPWRSVVGASAFGEVLGRSVGLELNAGVQWNNVELAVGGVLGTRSALEARLAYVLRLGSRFELSAAARGVLFPDIGAVGGGPELGCRIRVFPHLLLTASGGPELLSAPAPYRTLAVVAFGGILFENAL